MFKMTSNSGNRGIGQGPNGKGSIAKGALTLVQLVEGYIDCENYSVAQQPWETLEHQLYITMSIYGKGK